MKDKYNNSSSNNNFDNFGTDPTQVPQGDGHKFISSKIEMDLFDETKATPAPVFCVKRMNSAAKGERWRMLRDGELQFVLEGSKLSKKECMFLRTIEGFNWLIAEFKLGFKSLNELKSRLKKKM